MIDVGGGDGWWREKGWGEAEEGGRALKLSREEASEQLFFIIVWKTPIHSIILI